MSGVNGFEPKIVAYVCNWCTYLGADLAGTSRLEYPANIRILRLPCTGRIDTNLVVKAFEVGADAVLVSGCHPGDCHYNAGNYHARRRWMLFRDLLDTVGFDMRRIHFTWISAAEGKKFQQVVEEITEKARELGPYRPYESAALNGSWSRPAGQPRQAAEADPQVEAELRATARRLLTEGDVKVVIGYGSGKAGGSDCPTIPAFITRPEDADRLVWNENCRANLATYLTRKDVKALGKPAIVVKGCDEKAIALLEKEAQITRPEFLVIGVACGGTGEAKCASCDTPAPRFADITIGQAGGAKADGSARYAAVDAFMLRSPEERLAYWTAEFDRCVKCYACRQVCPLCYCERCIADKNRPQAIDTSPHRKGNFAWNIARAMHLAGRCVGCDECARACPSGIDLGLLNLAMARSAETHFGYRAGMDPAADPLIGCYSLQDKEEFIG